MNPFTWSGLFAPDGWAILLDLALKSTVLLLLVAIALPCLPRCSAATRHLGVLLGFHALLLLPLFSWMLPPLRALPAWFNITPPASEPANAMGAAGAREANASSANAARPVAAAATRLAESPMVSISASAVRNASADTSGRHAMHWGPALWVFCSLLALTPTVAGWLSLRRLARRSRVEAAGPLWESLQQLAAEAGLRGRIRLLTSSTRRMPMTWGLFHPVILLPSEAAVWSPERLQLVLRHELAHVERRDFASLLIARCACALYWFNPLVWMAAHRLRLEQERACDDLVLRSGAVSSGYAEEVLRLAAGPAGFAVEQVSGLAMARPSTLEARLLAILDGGRNRAAPTRGAVAVSVVAAVLAVAPVAMLRAAHGAPAAAGSTAAGAAAASADSSLVAWWRAEHDGKDSTGQHDGEFPFGVRYLPGVMGSAFDFRRSYAIDDLLPRVSIPDSPAFQLAESMTLEAWIHPLRYGGIVLFRGDDRPGFDNWQLDLITPGKISFNFDDAQNKSAELLAPIELGKWQHVVATFHQGAMKLYVQGALVAEAQTPLRPNVVLDAKHHPALGIGNTGGKHYTIPFDGLIDEVRIYNRALTAGEVAERAKR